MINVLWFVRMYLRFWSIDVIRIGKRITFFDQQTLKISMKWCNNDDLDGSCSCFNVKLHFQRIGIWPISSVSTHVTIFVRSQAWIFVPNDRIYTWCDCLLALHTFLCLFQIQLENEVESEMGEGGGERERERMKMEKEIELFPLTHFDKSHDKCDRFSTLARMKEMSTHEYTHMHTRTLIAIPNRQIFVSFVKLFMHVICNWLLTLSDSLLLLLLSVTDAK